MNKNEIGVQNETKTKKRKWIFILLFILLALFLLWAGVNAYTLLTAEDDIYDPEDTRLSSFPADAVLVLGAGVRSDGKPSMMLEDRLLTALSLYEDGLCGTVIVSGDHGTEGYDEVNVMKDYLVKRGVPSERIFMDHAGFSTYDSLYRATEIFGASRLMIVTQEYHAPRALMIARHLDIESVAVAAPIFTEGVTGYSRMPYYQLRESMARCKDLVFALFRPEPAFLGDPISLAGSGDVTNDREEQAAL